MLQEMHVLLLDRQGETTHDRVVHGQNLVHATNAVVQRNHIAEDFREHFPYQRPSPRKPTIQVVHHQAHHRSLAHILRQEQVEVLSEEPVADVLSNAVDADVRARDELHEEFVHELEIVPLRVQKGHLDVERVVLELVREGERTKQNVADHSKAVFQCFRKIENVPVARPTDRDELLDGVVANTDLSVVALVLQIELRATDADLPPEERSHLIVRHHVQLRQIQEHEVIRHLSRKESNYSSSRNPESTLNCLGKGEPQKEAHPILSDQDAVEVDLLLDHAAATLAVLPIRGRERDYVHTNENSVLLQQLLLKRRKGRLLQGMDKRNTVQRAPVQYQCQSRS